MKFKEFFNAGFTERNGRISWKRFIDNDNVIIATNNIKFLPGFRVPVLAIANNKIVYLNLENMLPIKFDALGLESYALKLSRSSFVPEEVGFEFEDIFFEKETTFDDIVEIAKEQDNTDFFWEMDVE